MNNIFAKWLLSHVQESKYTRLQIANKIGVSKAGLDKWLSGENTPKVSHLLNLCHLLFEPQQATMYYLYASNLLGGHYVAEINKSNNTGATGGDGST